MLISVAGLAFSACVGDAETGSETAEIVGGGPTTAYPEVVYISAVVDGEGAACTGTLISRRVVLTAAHCTDGVVTSQSVYFGTTRIGGDGGFIERIDVIDRIVYPNWSLSGGDIALLLLERESTVTPVDINRTILNSGDVGEPIDLVGWGDTDFEAGGAGVKRYVQSYLQGFQNTYVYGYGTSGANTCQGDSGGPGFMNLGAGRRVAGVTSWGTGGCTGGSGAMRVARHANWIDNWVAANDQVLPPDVEITSPGNGATVAGFFNIAVDATDNVEVERVELWLNGSLHQTVRSKPYVFNADLPDGPATIQARAYDNIGDMGTHSISVTVDSSCQQDNDCPTGQFCDNGTCTPSTGGIGDTCVDNIDCASGLCGNVGDESYCTQLCEIVAQDCPEGFECIDAGGTGACIRSSADGGDSGGCSASRGGAHALAWMLFGLGFLFVTRRRRGRMA